MKKDSTLLVIYPDSGRMSDSVFSLLVAETGEVLAQHLCSNASFASGDLYHRRPERIEEYGKRFGEVVVKFYDETEITAEELMRRNKEYSEEVEK